MDNKNELTTTQVAILLDITNKYIPGKKRFRLQSITGLQENSTSINSESVSKSNILNKDTSALPINSIKTSDVIELEIPKDVSRNYPTKFIPPGTRFIVSFTSGDITKPTIIGREF
jgi:hypothetical protein